MIRYIMLSYQIFFLHPSPQTQTLISFPPSYRFGSSKAHALLQESKVFEKGALEFIKDVICS